MSFRADATFGVSLLRSFLVSSVQIWAWAWIASGFGMVGVLPINVMAGLCPGHPRLFQSVWLIKASRGCLPQGRCAPLPPTVMPAKAGIHYSLTHRGDYWIIRLRG